MSGRSKMKTDDGGPQDALLLIPARDPGDDFEQMCWGLLRRRYPPQDLIYIPAEMGGDYGIEGFSDDGTAYQCYADRDSPSLRERTNKQKAKLTRDTLKLRKNATEIEALLDGLVFHHYVLFVPQYHAAELVVSAASRSEAVRSWGLAFVAADFAIRIKTPEDYPAELTAAMEDRAAHAMISTPGVTEERILSFPGERPDLVKTLDEKLGVLSTQTGANESVLRDKLIRAYLAREQILGQLQREWPHLSEGVERARRVREEALEIESELDSDAPDRRVLTLLEGYKDHLLGNVPGIREPDAQQLAHGQVADWLMRCPMRFRPA